MKRFQTRVPGSVPKDRLDLFLGEWLPHAAGRAISKTQIRTLILSGSVYVNRHRNKITTTNIFSGATIEVYFDEDKLQATQYAPMTETFLNAEKVIYEDEYLIVINKESGLPTQPTIDPNRANLYDLLKRMLAQRDKVEAPYVGLHHRLDKDTSGLVLFTKREDANKGVSELFSQHLIQKTYQCIVWRSPDAKTFNLREEFTVENYLGKISDSAGKARYGQVHSGGDRAITDFMVAEVYRDTYWLRARPKTGRTHQIRAHAAELGLPILGDALYFPEKVAAFISAPRLLLHASDLVFIHPITREKIELSIELPSEFVEVLGQLKA